MEPKWVETSAYVGLCRRRGDAAKRLFERRKRRAAIKPPSISTLERRLQVLEAGLHDPKTRQRYLDLIDAAEALAVAIRDFAARDRLRERLRDVQSR